MVKVQYDQIYRLWQHCGQNLEGGNTSLGWEESEKSRISKQVKLNGPVVGRETSKSEKLTQ